MSEHVYSASLSSRRTLTFRPLSTTETFDIASSGLTILQFPTTGSSSTLASSFPLVVVRLVKTSSPDQLCQHSRPCVCYYPLYCIGQGGAQMDIEHNRKRAMIGGLTHLQLHLWVVALSLPLLFEAFRLNKPLLHLSVEPCQPETGSSLVVRSIVWDHCVR